MLSKSSILKATYLEPLDNIQREILSRLSFTRELELYLAGGTALTFYLNHRTSIDFDFYAQKEFDAKDLALRFQSSFPETRSEIVTEENNTFKFLINNASLSCFYYPYPLIRELNEFAEIYVASLEDIAAMKVVSIVDFIDRYFMIRRFGIDALIEWTKEKYPAYSIHLMLKALGYFEDAQKDKETGRIQVLDPSFSWQKAKTYIEKEVIAYQKKFIKKG